MEEPIPPDTLDVTHPDHVGVLAELQQAVSTCIDGVTGYRHIVFGGPLMDAIRTGSPIPTDAELHVYVNGDIDQGQLLHVLAETDFTINGLRPIVIDAAAASTPEWEWSCRADLFAYETGCLTEITGLDRKNRPQLRLEPVYITSELAAIATALATVDDRTFQIGHGVTHDTGIDPHVTTLISVDVDRRAWLTQGLYLLAVADQDIIERELNSLTFDELQFLSALLDTHVAIPRIEDILAELNDGSQYELVVEARSGAQQILPKIHERAVALDPGPETLRSRARRFLGLADNPTTLDLMADALLASESAPAPAPVEAELAKVYDNFMGLREQRMKESPSFSEPGR